MIAAHRTTEGDNSIRYNRQPKGFEGTLADPLISGDLD
jgi:hypothetical protein